MAPGWRSHRAKARLAFPECTRRELNPHALRRRNLKPLRKASRAASSGETASEVVAHSGPGALNVATSVATRRALALDLAAGGPWEVADA
jgi:hypothetical protein